MSKRNPPPLEITLSIEQMATVEATRTMFAFVLMWAKHKGWWAHQEIVEAIRHAKNHATTFPFPHSDATTEEMTDIYNKEWQRFFAGIEEKLKEPPDPTKLKNPRDFWRVIPGGKS